MAFVTPIVSGADVSPLKGEKGRCFKVYLFKKVSQKVVDLTESTKNLLKK
jgi:hypothetical protein